MNLGKALPSAERDNASRLQRIMEEIDRTWNFAPLITQLADDVVFRVTVPEGTPLSGEFRGKDAVARYFTKILPSVAVFRQQAPMEFIAYGERVIILGDDAYTLKKTGDTFRSPYAMIVTYRGEDITNILIIQDLHGLAAAYREPGRR